MLRRLLSRDVTAPRPGLLALLLMVPSKWVPGLPCVSNLWTGNKWTTHTEKYPKLWCKPILVWGGTRKVKSGPCVFSASTLPLNPIPQGEFSCQLHPWFVCNAKRVLPLTDSPDLNKCVIWSLIARVMVSEDRASLASSVHVDWPLRHRIRAFFIYSPLSVS